MSKLNRKKLERKLQKYLKDNKIENALKTANRLSKMFPDEADYLLTKANCFEILEKYEEAAKEYKAALKVLGKEDIEDYISVSMDLAEINMFEDVLDVIEEGLKIEPNHQFLVVNKANALINLNRIDEAFEYIDDTSKTSNHWKELLIIKADLEIEFGNDEKAIQVCDEILEKEFDIDILGKKVRIFSDLGLFEDAEELINPLLHDEEYKGWAVSEKAILYMVNDNEEKALLLLDDFLKENPDDPNGNMTKAKILLDNESYDESEKYFRKAIEGDDYEDEEIMGSLLIATLFSEAGNDERALELLDSIPEDSPDHDLAQLIKYSIYKEIDEEEENLNDENKIKEYFANDPRMHLERGEFQGTEAYDLIAKAWGDDNPRKSRQLAKKAIKVDKYAIDAYNVLAYHTLNDDLRKEYFKTAIDLFYETHDEEYFDTYTGYFWGYVETRPFMRALQGYADVFHGLGDYKKAADYYGYMLELNPGDNQGVRYSFINVLFVLNRLDEVLELFEEYDDEYSAHFLFSKLLLAIKSEEDEESIKKLYFEAIESNKYVVPFLLGKKRLPSKMPGFYSPGDSSEAIDYYNGAVNSWEFDKSALDILEYLDVKYRVKNS